MGKFFNVVRVGVLAFVLVSTWALLAEFMPLINLAPSANAWFFCIVPAIVTLPPLLYSAVSKKMSFFELTKPKRFFSMKFFVLQPLGMFLEHYLWILSLLHTTPAMNTVVYLNYPTIVVILSKVVLKKTYVWQVWFSCLLSLVGVILVVLYTTKSGSAVTKKAITDQTTTNTFGGYLLDFAASLCFAVYLVAAEGMGIPSSGHGKLLDGLSGSFYQGLLVIFPLIIIPVILVFCGVEAAPTTITLIDVLGASCTGFCFISANLISTYANSVVGAFVSILVIPATYYLDWMRSKLILNAGGIAGSLCVIGSFCITAYYNLTDIGKGELEEPLKTEFMKDVDVLESKQTSWNDRDASEDYTERSHLLSIRSTCIFLSHTPEDYLSVRRVAKTL